jgi:uncharacterized protein YabN with tetrapyrrole methylase and pyrophosphatase domain
VNNSSIPLESSLEEKKKDLDADIRIIDLAWRHTREFALQAGIDFSIGDFIYEVHNNYSFYETNIFSDLFEQVTKGNDIAIAVPKKTSIVNV